MQRLGSLLQEWMKQPGLIKQLELALSIAIIVIILLTQQLISNSTTKNQNIKKEASTSASTLDQKQQVTETELDNLARDYLSNFFSIQPESIDYLQAHTETSLYTQSLESEIKKRIELKITSIFELNDLYIESINSTQAKAICIGQESFPNNDYENRDFHIELIIDTNSMQIVSIPKFQIN